jgi:hypothetical protein
MVLTGVARGAWPARRRGAVPCPDFRFIGALLKFKLLQIFD